MEESSSSQSPSDSDPASSSPQFGTLVGEIVAGHELYRLLTVGGMGEVYLAKHLGLGVVRAIKLIRADLRGRDQALQRFTREAQVLARLQHNCIVQVIEVGSMPNGWPFLTMEYIEGPNLDELLDNQVLPLAKALIVLEQIALALHHAHTNNVIHRDLKPSNILVRSGDVRQVKIIDFGLARILDGDGERITADGQRIGSPTFMAPEQAEGATDVTAAADVYALAGIAYLLLSGEPPFLHKRRIPLMAAHVSDAPPRLSQRCPTVPPFLDELLIRCLAKDPARRPPAAEIATLLGEHLQGMPLDEPEPAALPRVELVESPWGAAAPSRDIEARLFDMPMPRDPEGLGLRLATKIMAMVEEIATYLSTSDTELTTLLRLEARICEQLTTVERELATISTRLEDAQNARRVAMQREALLERIRTLNAQQLPLQRRMVQVVEAYRPHASRSLKPLFDRLDRALDELESLRRKLR
jgi:serine/threonine protein kinase